MALKIHHLNCGTLCPISQKLFNGQGAWTQAGTLICHCLLLETEAGLVLVDTGLGREDVRLGFLNPLLDTFAPPRYVLEETAYAQIQALGFDPRDVRHIILTHLDLDHAGGLSDFPQAQVHVHIQEYRGAVSQPSLPEIWRYLPRQWRHGVQWVTYAPQGEPWMGFEAVRALKGLPEDILLIPLPGHTRGHSGVAIQTAQGWLLHAGDAYFDRRQLDFPGLACPPALMLLQILEPWNSFEWSRSLLRLQSLARRHPEIQILCSHDPAQMPDSANFP